MAINNEKSFLVQKKSNLAFSPTGSSYFDRMRYTRSGIPLSTKFDFSFNSNINPTILPGINESISSLDDGDVYIVSETGEFLLTEDNNYIISNIGVNTYIVSETGEFLLTENDDYIISDIGVDIDTYIVSETGEFLLTEDNNNIIT
jgi:hypothetical protein